MAEKKFGAQVNYGWGLTLNMTGKAPAVAKRIFDTYADALAYANDANDSAIEGLVLSVVADTDAALNGVYFVQQVGVAAVEADEEKGIEAVDAIPAILVKLGSADAAAGDTADALKEAKEYTDAEVKKLADGAVKTNTDAIAVLNGNAETDGSVAKAVATEKARALAAESGLTAAIDAEIEAREAADQAINDTIGTVASGKTVVEMIEDAQAAAKAAATKIADKTDGHVTVSVAQDDSTGALTYTISESDIASAEGLQDEIDRAVVAEASLQSQIGKAATEQGGPTGLHKAIADVKGAYEAAIEAMNVTKTGEGTFVDVTVKQANGVITEVTVAESDIASAQALANEVTARTSADDAIKDRLDVIEGEGVGSIKKAVADAKSELLGEVAEDYNTLGKLEDKVIAAEAAAKAAATVVDEDSEFINIEQTGEVGKTQTYTIKTQNIASISDLATEISRAQEAEQTNSNAINSIKSDYLKSSDKLELSQAIVSETEARIQAISNLEFKNSLKLDGVVQSEELLDTLPDVQSGALYSVGPDSNDRYKLYAYVNNSWTYMGYLNSSSIDITQSLGQSQNLAISQKAVTDALTPIIMTQAEFDALVSNGTITDDDLTIRYIID